MRTRNLSILWRVVCCAAAAASGFAQVNVVTQHNDNDRTGQNTEEFILTPANVNPNSFGKLFSQPVDGDVYAQPLYLSRVSIPSQGVHDVVYVATENDSVYAFDAATDRGSNAVPLWQASFINRSEGIEPVPSSDEGCTDLVPEIGITGTPVIDPSTHTLYVVANTKERGVYVQRLHALDVATGEEKFGGPVVIQATVGTETFNPELENQRAGLLLQHGEVYIGWASHCDIGPYTGWVMAYDAATLRQAGAFVTTKNYDLGGAWMAGSGLAGDRRGSVYLATGNGTFSGDHGGEYGDSILRLGFDPSRLSVQDYFTPDNEEYLNENDLDLGSGGVLLLPPQPGGHPRLLIQTGKEGTIYLVDRTNLGHYSPSSNNNVQTLYFAVGGVWGMPAYWNSTVYFWGAYDVIKAFSLTNGLLSTSPVSQGLTGVQFPGSTPSVSSNGGSNGIVWSLQTDAYVTSGPAVLHAYDATNVGVELWNSNLNFTEDDPGGAVKFTVPTVANGRVYAPAAGRISVYGLRPQLAPKD